MRNAPPIATIATLHGALVHVRGQCVKAAAQVERGRARRRVELAQLEESVERAIKRGRLGRTFRRRDGSVRGAWRRLCYRALLTHVLVVEVKVNVQEMVVV